MVENTTIGTIHIPNLNGVITKSLSFAYNGKRYVLNINKDITAYQSAKLTEFIFKIQESVLCINVEFIIEMIYEFEIENQFNITDI